ncbi:hypothetical protein K9N08_04820 [Candidatus Gracilibacteria bacterium]|nr:hypothetical protein [Candidatus Gracilibacteria bacterium]MCF7856826.1 hypothetical protein [Candidatus Gracilibacteria bacterium]MCF7897100.1 hypothetical protein [Candidatus Gracilibacteria bacterium]
MEQFDRKQRADEFQEEASKLHEAILTYGKIHCCCFSRAVAIMNKYVLEFLKNKKITIKDVEEQIASVRKIFENEVAKTQKQTRQKILEVIGKKYWRSGEPAGRQGLEASF